MKLQDFLYISGSLIYSPTYNIYIKEKNWQTKEKKSNTDKNRGYRHYLLFSKINHCLQSDTIEINFQYRLFRSIQEIEI